MLSGPFDSRRTKGCSSSHISKFKLGEKGNFHNGDY